MKRTMPNARRRKKYKKSCEGKLKSKSLHLLFEIMSKENLIDLGYIQEREREREASE